MAEKSTSLQLIMRQRQRDDFVGRREHVDSFRANLQLPPDHSRRQFVFSIFGQGGVGKTTLMRRFHHLAEEAKAFVAWSDDTEDSVVAVMGRLADQFRVQAQPLKKFSDLYRTYLQRRQELESDPDAPKGTAAFVGKTLLKTGMKIAGHTPVGGLILDFIDQDAIAAQVGEWSAFVANKITNKDEVHLLRDPLGVLTPLLLEGLRGAALEQNVALFFDTYERTGVFLDDWLRDVIDGRYGDLPGNIVMSIAGRDELDRNLWSEYRAIATHIPLEPFTENEAREFLSAKGVRTTQSTTSILGLSGGLPLLLATLVVDGSGNQLAIEDPSGTAVERFLKWVDDSDRRRLALDAALPRWFNQDILTAFEPDLAKAESFFEWLKQMPFVQVRKTSWCYHPTVRQQMLRYKHHKSPHEWVELNRRLAEYHERQYADVAPSTSGGGVTRFDKVAHQHAIEALYHRLCEAPEKFLSVALEQFLLASEIWADPVHTRSLLEAHVEVFAEAATNTGNEQVALWSIDLRDGLKDYYGDQSEQAGRLFDKLASTSKIGNKARAIAMCVGGRLDLFRGDVGSSLRRVDDALAITPDSNSALILKAFICFITGRLDTSIDLLMRVLELGCDSIRVSGLLGFACLMAGRFDDSVSYLESASALRSDDHDLRAMYASALALAGRLDDSFRVLKVLSDSAVDGERSSGLRGLMFLASLQVLSRDSSALAWARIQGDLVKALRGGGYDISMVPASSSEHSGAFEKMVAQMAPPMIAQFVQKADLRYSAAQLTPEGMQRMIKSSAKPVDFAVARAFALAQTLDNQGRLNEALECLDGVGDLIVDCDQLNAYGLYLSRAGRYSQAVSSLNRALAQRADLFAFYNRAVAAARCDNEDAAHNYILEARDALSRDLENGGSHALYGLAGLEAVVGQPERALEGLHNAVTADLTGNVITWARQDPAWLDLRSDSRFLCLLEQCTAEGTSEEDPPPPEQCR